MRDLNNNIVRRLNYGTYLMPSGSHTAAWDGSKDDGSPAPPNYYYYSIQAVSAYGCALNSWCNQFLSSSSFWFYGSTCEGGGGGDPSAPAPAGIPPIMRQPWPPPCDPEPSAGVKPEGEPTTVFLRQRVFSAGRPLARVMDVAASAPDAATQTSTGSLTEVVRAYGVRGLSFGIPRSATVGVVSIRIYTLAGRPIRALVNESLQAGYYEIAWDGLDDRGRPATPGVYFAVLTAGSERQTQRLILRQP